MTFGDFRQSLTATEPPPYIAMKDHDRCYDRCPEDGTIHIGVNDGDSHWTCFRHLDRWNQTRARRPADGGGHEMQRLGELPCDECVARRKNFDAGNRATV